MAVVLLSGCWSQIGFGPEHRRHNTVESSLTTANVAGLTEAWTVEVDGSASELITADGRVFTTITGPNGASVLAVDAATGEELWGTTLVDTSAMNPKPTVTAVPVAFANEELLSAYVSYDPTASSCTSDAIWMDPVTGARQGGLWANVGAPVVAAEKGFFVVAAREVKMVDGRCTGSPVSVTVLGRQPFPYLWSGWVPGAPASPFSLMSTAPMVVNGGVFLANGSTLSRFPLYGCDPFDCRPTWAVDLGMSIDGSTPVGGESGQVYLTPTGGPLLAVSAEDGSELWRVEGRDGQRLGVAVADGFVFLSQSRGSANRPPALEVYDGATGARVGSTTSSTQETVTAPTIAGGVLYRGTATRVEAYDAAACTRGTCPIIGSVPLPGPPRALSVANGRLLVAGSGYIAAYVPD